MKREQTGWTPSRVSLKKLHLFPVSELTSEHLRVSEPLFPCCVDVTNETLRVDFYLDYLLFRLTLWTGLKGGD